MTRDGWKNLIINSYGDRITINMLARLLEQVDNAKQLLSDSCHSCTGMSLLDSVKAIQEDLNITDKLLLNQYKVIDRIPPCSVHGNKCIPHAIEWIESKLKDNKAYIGICKS